MSPTSALQVVALAGISASSVGSSLAPLVIRKRSSDQNKHIAYTDPHDETKGTEPTRFSLQHVCFGPLGPNEEISQRAHLIEKWEWYTTQVATASLAHKASEIGKLSEDDIMNEIANAKIQLGLVPSGSDDNRNLLEHAKTFMTANGFELFGSTAGGRPIYALGATQILDRILGPHWYLSCCPDHVSSASPSDDELTEEEKIMKEWVSVGMRLSDFHLEIDFGIQEVSRIELEYVHLMTDWRQYWMANISEWDKTWKEETQHSSEPAPLNGKKAKQFLGKHLATFMEIHGYDTESIDSDDGVQLLFTRKPGTLPEYSVDTEPNSAIEEKHANTEVTT